MTVILLLLACSSNGKDGEAAATGSSPDVTNFTVDEALLQLQSPASGSFIPVGSASVEGLAHAMDDVLINGVAADVSGGTFRGPVDFPMGISALDITGADIEGGAHRDFGAVLAGDFAAPDGPVYNAIQLHLSAQALDDLSTVAGRIIDPSLLNPSLQALNPIVDSPDARVSLGTLRFDEPTMQLVPTAAGLRMMLTLPNFVLPIEATFPDALLFGIDLDLNPDLEADAVILNATVDLSTNGNGNGKLEIDLKNVTAELQGFDLDTGILELVDWLVLDDDDLAAIIETQIANVGPGLGAALEGIVAGLDLKTELDLLGTPLVIWPAFDDADVDASGLTLSMAVAVDVTGPPTSAPGHLHFPPPPPRGGQNMLMQISDDFMNRALFELWSGGALDIELPLEAPADIAILALFGGNTSGNLSLKAGLPPVWLEKDGRTRLQLGDALLVVETPGGTYGDKVELRMNLDAAADLEVTAAAAGVVLSDPKIIMVPTGDSATNPDLLENIGALQGAFGLGIGIINGLLSFPLDGLLGPDVALPDLALERDPSGVALATDLDLAELDLVTLLLGPVPPESILVPATAQVLDDDLDLTLDGEEGWICENNDVTTSGNNGVWYVEDRSELVVTGTGHVIWAMDGADIVLDAPGNEVFAHPGANIQDNDGSNVVTILDPLTLDLSAAPVPGC